MSYHCERCGAHLDDLATQCGCDLPPTKAEIDRARIGHATPIMDAVIAERNRLRAEVDARDEVITRLLEMLKNARKSIAYVDHVRGPVVDELHARAIAIAGRTE